MLYLPCALSKRVLEEGKVWFENNCCRAVRLWCGLALLSVQRKASKIIPLLSLQIQNGEQKIVPQIHYSVKGNANGLISRERKLTSPAHTLAYSLTHFGQRMALHHGQLKKWLVLYQWSITPISIKAITQIFVGRAYSTYTCR